MVIDFAGNLWRHMVHPDQDPPWEEVASGQTIEEVNERKAGARCRKCGSTDIYGPIDGRYKCEKCKHEWDTKKPWVCPHCKQALSPWQKCVGGKCPNCGAKVSGKAVKQIRFEDGTIRAVPADEVKRRKKKNRDSEQAAWDSLIFAARGFNRKQRRNGGKRKMTLDTCRGIFKSKMGHWPRDGMKYVPEDPADWKRVPEEVFPWLKK